MTSVMVLSAFSATLQVTLSWFYDFWLSVFHIITSCSVLGVKIANALVPGTCPEEKEELRSPEDCLSTVIIPAQGNRYKACRSPDLSLLSSRLIVLAFGSSRCCSRLHARLQY